MNGHDLDHKDLASTCKVCGMRFSIVAALNPSSVPQCPGAPPSMVRSTLVVTDCECGAKKTGIDNYAIGHSSWCPVKAP